MALSRWMACAVVMCACAPLPTTVPSFSLAGTDGHAHAIYGERPTVLVFFSDHCPCVRAHDERLIALANTYSDRVSFLAIDSEIDATVASSQLHARDHGYPFPIVVDTGARVARALGAEYATFAVIVDAHRNVLYRGGFDSDHTHLSSSTKHYLREALDDVVAGRAVQRARTEALGCALRTW